MQVFFEFQFLSGYVHDGNCYKVLGSLSRTERERERKREMSTTYFAAILRTDRVEFIKDARASLSLGE